MWPIEAAALAAFAILLAFAGSNAQTGFASRVGSDHPVHVLLRDGIRRNGGRLFITVPRLLNVVHCAALPLYLHWVLARLPVGLIPRSERLLNPLLNAVHAAGVTVIAWMALPSGPGASVHPGHVAVIFAMTPQFFHALSARNFGLSARGTGLLLLTAFLAAAQLATSTPSAWLVMAMLAWQLWGFSTFAAQAMVLLGVLLLAMGIWQPAAGVLLGLVLFVALHPRYSLSYLKHTLRFMHAYARDMAAIYVLQRRPSIWRDLVFDLWRKPAEVGVKKAFLYAYENSVLVLVLLNPLALVAAWHWVDSPAREPWEAFAGAVSFAGLAAMLLTSFRQTRFLGEPERYVEAVTPWISLSGTLWVGQRFGVSGVWALAAAFALINAAQVFASWLLMRHVKGTGDELGAIASAAAQALGDEVRFCSNNEQLTKLLMDRPWQFACFIAVGQDYAGMTANEAFSRFPFLRLQACERVVQTYRVNCLLLDRDVFDGVFEVPPADLVQTQSLYQSARFRLLRLVWRDGAGAPAAAHSAS